MRAFIIDTKTVIEPFGDKVGETLLLDRSLKETQTVFLRECGCSFESCSSFEDIPTLEEPYLVLHDSLFLTPRLLKEFLALAASMGPASISHLWLKKGLFTRLLAVLQETEQTPQQVSMPLWYVSRGTFSPQQSIKVVIDVDEESYEGNFPKHMIGKDGYRFCVTSRPAVNITHPLHLALANMAANFARLAELKKMPWSSKLMTLFRAKSVNKYSILSTISTIHPEAEVHPTAVIEGSVVEKGAKIGAHAVVRFSHIGEKAFIDDHAGVKFSMVGKEAYVANNCVLFFSVVYPRAFLISGPFQFTLFGYDSAIMNAIPSDYRLDSKTISIKTNHGYLDTGLRFVGSVIGHRTKIAAGVIIAPGRLVPNDLLIFPDPGRIIQSIPHDVARQTPLFLIDGKLVQADKIKQSNTQQESPNHRRSMMRPHSGNRNPNTDKGEGKS